MGSSRPRLSSFEQRLIQSAMEAQQRAYAPYSDFPVGAALGTAKGEIYCGCNVENASFGLTVCAERNALATAIVCGERDFVRLAIVSTSNPPASPCGACRQVLAEFANELLILLVNDSGVVERVPLTRLLPLSFSGQMVPRRR